MYIQSLSTVNNYYCTKNSVKSVSKISHPTFGGTHNPINSSRKYIDYGNIFKEGANLAGQKLRKAKKAGAYLVGAILCGANLEKSAFEGAIFTRADLQNTNFQNSNLKGAHFIDTITNNTNLMFTNLVGAEFKGDRFGPWTMLQQANVCRANFKDVDVENGINFSDAFYDIYTKFPSGFDPDYFDMKLIEKGANFSNLQNGLKRAKLRCTIFDDVNFNNSSLKRADLMASRFNNCNMHNTDWTRAYAKSSVFYNCDLSGSKLKQINLEDAELANVDLRNSNLKGARLNWHAISNIKLDGAKYDQYTEFKPGFNPRAYGMVYEESPLAYYGIK